MYLISYDISEDKIRTRLANRLVAEGCIRMQLSVFIGSKNPMRTAGLGTDIKSWIKQDVNARFMVVSIPAENLKTAFILGVLDDELEALIFEKTCIFV